MSVAWKSEYAKLLDVVTVLLSRPEPEVAWTLIGEHLLNAHFDAEVFTINVMSSTSAVSEVPWSTPSWVAHRVPPPAELHELFLHHPLVRHLQTAPNPMATRRSSDAVAMSRWLNSPTHSELKATLGISHQLAIPLPRRGGALRTVVLMRPGHDFSDRDVEVARHLQRLLVALDTSLSLSSPTMTGRGHGNGAGPSSGCVALTPRELDVLSLLARGRTADSIARRLGVSNRTVHKHLEHVYAKLGASDRLSAVLRAQRLGILDGPTG